MWTNEEINSHPLFLNWVNDQKRRFWLDHKPFKGDVILTDNKCICKACNKGDNAGDDYKPYEFVVTSLNSDLSFSVGRVCCKHFIAYDDPEEWKRIQNKAEFLSDVNKIKNGLFITITSKSITYAYNNSLLDSYSESNNRKLFDLYYELLYRDYNKLSDDQKDVIIDVNLRLILKFAKWDNKHLDEIFVFSASDKIFIKDVFSRCVDYENQPSYNQMKYLIPKFKNYYEWLWSKNNILIS